jgi:hypothetical protein
MSMTPRLSGTCLLLFLVINVATQLVLIGYMNPGEKN